MKDSDIFGTGGSIGFDMKFTGCGSSGYGVSRSEVYMCHDSFCNDQSPCKHTTGALDASSRDSISSSGAPCVWIGTSFSIITAIAAVLTI
jgi:hypothetical protein